MDQIRQCLLIGAAICLASAARAQTSRFYPDDPLWLEPHPRNVGEVKPRKLSDYHDFFLHTFAHPGERQNRKEPVIAKNVNTLGEVPDSPWYTNRLRGKRVTLEQLAAGPDTGNPPSVAGPWTVTKAKSEGVTPGLEIDDARGIHYWLKFDPRGNPEMATSADVIGSAFFYALGYNVPEYYLVHFDRDKLVVAPNSRFTDRTGKKRKLSERDVDEILLDAPHDAGNRYRAVASLSMPGRPAGEFQYFGTRKDDPNDIVPHEHRRELRGLFVFCAWLGHEDSRAINTYDTLVEENGVRFLKHYLIDFGSLLGSASTKPNSPRSTHEYLFSVKPALAQFVSLGLYVPRWARADYPDFPSVGRFEHRIFDPEAFKPDYPNPAFANRLPDDDFWAAKQVMMFTDTQIRAIVRKADMSDPQAESWIAECLAARRDKIGRTYFAKVLPLDHFQVKDGRLDFEDLSVQHNLAGPREYRVQWLRFDNLTNRTAPLDGQPGVILPRELRTAAPGEYFAAEIRGENRRQKVIAYLRSTPGDPEVVGIDRTW